SIKAERFKHIENQLRDDDLKGWDDIKVRIKQHLTPESVLFRHAIRLSIVLLISYIFVQVSNIEYGYWILLTALFVSQPNFNATKRRLRLRIVGTLVGIIFGYAILYFVPSVEGQLLLLVFSGILFFELRSKQYAQATAFITILALINWILLTALFVSQPNFNATKRRLRLRIVGTLVGIIFGYAILYFVPSVEGQLLLLVFSGILFFELRSKQYAQATAFITILALIN